MFMQYNQKEIYHMQHFKAVPGIWASGYPTKTVITRFHFFWF